MVLLVLPAHVLQGPGVWLFPVWQQAAHAAGSQNKPQKIIFKRQGMDLSMKALGLITRIMWENIYVLLIAKEVIHVHNANFNKSTMTFNEKTLDFSFSHPSSSCPQRQPHL